MIIMINLKIYFLYISKNKNNNIINECNCIDNCTVLLPRKNYKLKQNKYRINLVELRDEFCYF